MGIWSSALFKSAVFLRPNLHSPDLRHCLANRPTNPCKRDKTAELRVTGYEILIFLLDRSSQFPTSSRFLSFKDGISIVQEARVKGLGGAFPSTFC